MDATLIVSRDGATESARDGLARLAQELAPVAADLGCASEFAGVETILTIGASYERQRAVAAAARPGQGLDAVVDLMRAEMGAGRPLALAEFVCRPWRLAPDARGLGQRADVRAGPTLYQRVFRPLSGRRRILDAGQEDTGEDTRPWLRTCTAHIHPRRQNPH